MSLIISSPSYLFVSHAHFTATLFTPSYSHISHILHIILLYLHVSLSSFLPFDGTSLVIYFFYIEANRLSKEEEQARIEKEKEEERKREQDKLDDEMRKRRERVEQWRKERIGGPSTGEGEGEGEGKEEEPKKEKTWSLEDDEGEEDEGPAKPEDGETKPMEVSKEETKQEQPKQEEEEEDPLEAYMKGVQVQMRKDLGQVEISNGHVTHVQVNSFYSMLFIIITTCLLLVITCLLFVSFH